MSNVAIKSYTDFCWQGKVTFKICICCCIIKNVRIVLCIPVTQSGKSSEFVTYICTIDVLVYFCQNARSFFASTHTLS